ncbi:MAG TPA: flagellar hook capping FlgD N-terminal domain-containing protein [Bryobacteraceae bacterium]|jgi:flagellar basal-body rod modification protein FlgD
MAAVGSILPSSSTDNDSSTQKASTQTSLANESTFLTLLVTQLKNQNPMNPMDGTAFVTQLAQFSDLEQNVAMRQDLDALTAKYAPTTATPTTDSNSNS